MSTPSDVLVHPTNHDRVQTYKGFSWPCLFFGCFWYVAKGLWGLGLLAFLLAVVTFGLAWLVFPFFANEHYRKSLLRDGYTLSGDHDGARRACPHCAESIKTDATVCRFCGRDVPAGTPATPAPSAAVRGYARHRTRWDLVGYAVLGLMALGLVGSLVGKLVSHPAASAARNATKVATVATPNRVQEITGRFKGVPDVAIVWRNAQAMDEGVTLIRANVHKSNPLAVMRLAACVVSSGTTGQIVGADSSTGKLAYEVLVTEGKRAGCRGLIPTGFFQRDVKAE